MDNQGNRPGNWLHRISKIQKETMWAGISKIITLAFFIATNALLARRLGVEVFGKWSYFFSMFTIVYFFSDLGINASIKVFVARGQREGYLKNCLRTGFTIKVVVCIAFACLLLLVSDNLASMMDRPQMGALFKWASLLLIAQGLLEFVKQVYQGLHRIRFNAIVSTLEFGMKFLGVVFFVIIGSTLVDVLHVFIWGSAAAAVVGLWLLYSVFYRRASSQESERLASRIARYATPLFLISVGSAITMELDSVMLGKMASDAEVGIFAPAKQISMKFVHISAVLAMGSLPFFADMSEEKRPELLRLMNKLLKLTMVIFSLVVVGILGLGWFIVPLLYGEDFAPSSLTLSLLTPYILFRGVSPIVSGIMDYRGKATRRALNLGLSMILHILLNLWLIPKYGANGSAIATSISYFPYALLTYIEARRSLSSAKKRA